MIIIVIQTKEYYIRKINYLYDKNTKSTSKLEYINHIKDLINMLEKYADYLVFTNDTDEAYIKYGKAVEFIIYLNSDISTEKIISNPDYQRITAKRDNLIQNNNINKEKKY